jgi:hypothetical protein
MSIKRVSRISLPIAIALAALALSLTTIAVLADGPVISPPLPNAAISTLFGETANAKTGHAIASGDVNGDGYQDLVVGAPYADLVPASGRLSGGVYLYLGRPEISHTLDLATGQANVTFYATPDTCTGEELGRSVAVGDLNGDGLDDIIMGSSYHGCSPIGAVYVWVGRPSLTTTTAISVDIAKKATSIYNGHSLMFLSAWVADHLGWDVAAGDVNGDGLDDIIIGAYQASADTVTSTGYFPPDYQRYHYSAADRQRNGTVYVRLGSTDLISSNGGTEDPMRCLPELTIYGEDSYDYLGRSLASGDIDGDGIDDLIVGAPGNPDQVITHTGKVYVFYGSNALTYTNCSVYPPLVFENQIVKELAYITTTADITLTGVTPGDRSGFDVSTGNLNGDTYADIIVGAPYANGNRGQVYVVYGGPRASMLSTTIPLSQADLTVSGAVANTWLGTSLFAGDVNGDGTDDLLMGAIGLDPNDADYSGTPDTSDKGAAYALFGGSLSGSLDLGSHSPDLTILGASSDDWLGRGLSLGDLNGDGFNELLVGAAGLDYNSRADTGAAYIINLVYPQQITVTGSLPQVAASHTVSFYATGKSLFGTHDVTTQTTFAISPGAGGTWNGNRYTASQPGVWTVTGTLYNLSDTTPLTVVPAEVSNVYLPIILR